MLSTLTTLALLASTALATPTPPIQRDAPTIPADWTWHITGWQAGCARTCSYNFNITVPSTTDIAGVKAYCSGYESGDVYTSCQILEGVNNGVSAKLGVRETEDGRGPGQVWFSFEKGGYQEQPPYNYTGSHETVYNAFVAPLLDFDVVPTSVVAVA